MHEWERRSSLVIRRWYRAYSPKYFQQFGEGDRFWQSKYYSFSIYERHKLEEKLQYMHFNPVRAGLVEKATDWPWSSSRWYQEHRSVGMPIHCAE